MSEDPEDEEQQSNPGEDIMRALYALHWGDGLTRNQIRRHYRGLPQAIYLRLPASKRYYSSEELLHDVETAGSRAEGEYLGSAPDLPEAESLDAGGPPAWGPSPLFTPGASVDGGSAEDRGSKPEPGE
ncbi:MAG TPA: hypothetical protein VGN32_15825 [Ktedonobacterales bacterium]|jgi:hypothetical protein|nr:hypothetical protein [Ktedonobacterales bacterium]